MSYLQEPPVVERKVQFFLIPSHLHLCLTLFSFILGYQNIAALQEMN